jgi:hypothetical protein
MTQYQQGEHVSVKAIVESVYTESNGEEVLNVSREVPTGGRMRYNVLANQVDRRLAKPFPGEPNRTALLRAKDGRIYTWRDATAGYGSGWRSPTATVPHKWDRGFYEAYGPFDVFEPKDTV